jgi:uncharacterized membrane protein required for colicin V production
MGLDIALGLVILAAAVRGWFRGFVLQAIRLAGLVGCVYVAAPVRDFARPYVAEYLKSVKPELLDRLLWWTAAVLSYVLAVGLASLAVKMYRRRPFGEVEPNRSDQFAGFLLGSLKGALIASFLVAGVQKHALGWLKSVDWAQEQAKDSYALQWDGQYHPAEKLWNSQPVQHYVSQVKRMGLMMVPGRSQPDPASPEAKALQAAASDGPPRLEIGDLGINPLDPTSPDFTREFDRLLEQISGPEAPRD